PPRPSIRLSRFAPEELTRSAQRRRMEGPRLISVLRGDLDWIVMKCLEKDRARRYETANGLMAGAQRDLQCQPVTACPPSTVYRLRKAVRRNKLAFAAGLAVALTLLAGLAATSWQAMKARRAEARAKEQFEIARATRDFFIGQLLGNAN